MADLPHCDLETDEAPQLRRVPQLHPSLGDDKQGPCTMLDERVDSGMGYSLVSSDQDSQQFRALIIEEVRDFLSSDCGRAVCSRQHEVDNRPVSYRSDSISTSLQNQLRSLSLSDSHGDDHLNKDSTSSLRCDSGICVSASSCYSSVGGVSSDCYPVLEAGFPECGYSSALQFDSNFSHQELLELFSQDEDGDTYLHMSIIHLLPDVALKVIGVAPHPDCVNIPNRLQQTPLHLAVATQQLLVARRLMVAGANLETPDHLGNTALHMACREGLVDMVDLLLTPVHYQESLANNQYPDLPMARVPQDLALRNYEGYTCAHLALQGGHLEVLQHLLNKGANINEPDGKSGRTLLHMAADLGYLPALQLLLAQRGLQLDARTYGGLTAVTLAHGRQLNHVVHLLTRAGADLSQIVALDRLNHESSESSSDEEMSDGVYDDICINGQPIHIS